MTNDRISEIEETLGLPDPVVKDSKIMCLQARDARHLLDLVRRQQEVVEAAEELVGDVNEHKVQALSTTHGHYKSLRRTLDKLEEHNEH